MRRSHPGVARRVGVISRAGLVELAGSVGQPEAFTNHLTFIQFELSDLDLRPGVRAHFEAALAAFRVLLDDAVSVGELRRCDTARYAPCS